MISHRPHLWKVQMQVGNQISHVSSLAVLTSTGRILSLSAKWKIMAGMPMKGCHTLKQLARHHACCMLKMVVIWHRVFTFSVPQYTWPYSIVVVHCRLLHSISTIIRICSSVFWLVFLLGPLVLSGSTHQSNGALFVATATSITLSRSSLQETGTPLYNQTHEGALHLRQPSQQRYHSLGGGAFGTPGGLYW